MLGGPLLYKILVLGTLVIGLLSLFGSLVGAGRHPAGPRRRSEVGGPVVASRDVVRKTDDQWRADLTEEQYQVTRRGVTERPFTGRYWDHHEEGVYQCVGCGQELFASEAKFEAESGWPSFCRPVADGALTELKAISYGTVRTEVVCSRCESHLGDVFPDGPKPTGLRYCINSAALDFKPHGPGVAVAGA